MSRAEELTNAERQSWELHLVQAAEMRTLLDLHAPKTEGNLQTRLTQVFAQLVPPAQEIAWRCVGDGLKRFMTQNQYDAQEPGVKKWYEPFKCAGCLTIAQPVPANAYPPETAAEFALKTLVSARLVSQQKVDQVMQIAAKFTAHLPKPRKETP